ncbi:MAG: LysR family transcriptional regulator [Gammaproteobacteria bacterium]|nr:LysR family transcriptional regulator [Gammaproteobacteria bacterium]
MNLKQLRAFTEVVKTGSVSEAARRLHRSQPAVSAVIASLEDELGMSLFIRKGMRLKPAPEAQFLLREADEILQKVENAKKTMIDVRQTERGILEIVSMPGPTVILFPFLIDRFLGLRKQVRVTLKTKTSPEVEQIISAQNSDMGFADFDLIEDHEDVLVNHEVFDFDCFCAIPANDPLVKKSSITPEDLDGKPLATLYPDHPTTIQVRQAFESLDLTFDSYFCAQYFIPLFTFVERGSAYSVMDRMSVQCYLWQKEKEARKIVFRPFVPEVVLRTSIITPTYRPMSMLAQKFHTEFRQALSEIQNREYSDEN